MIITVTMNPAIDKTAEFKKLLYGGLNRIETPRTDAGGKGINVSRTIRELGGETIAAGFLWRGGSEIILEDLDRAQIRHDFILLEGTTRTNLKLVEQDGTLTEINEKGPAVTQEALEQLICKLEQYAAKQVLFVLGGSIPAGIGTDCYARITERVKRKGARVFVDADGELLQKTLAAKVLPDLIKPNQMELLQYFGADASQQTGEAQLLSLGRTLRSRGIQTVAISRGGDGALFLTPGGDYACAALPVEVRSTVGAGDAMVAALCHAIDRNGSFAGVSRSDGGWEQCIRLAMAVSAAAVTTSGTRPASQETVSKLEKLVQLRELSRGDV